MVIDKAQWVKAGYDACKSGRHRDDGPSEGTDYAVAWLAGYDAEIEAQAGRADEPATACVPWIGAASIPPSNTEMVMINDVMNRAPTEPSPYPALMPADYGLPQDAFCQKQKAWKSTKQQMQQQRLIASQQPQQQFTQAEFDIRYMKPTQGAPVSDELAAAKAEIAAAQPKACGFPPQSLIVENLKGARAENDYLRDQIARLQARIAAAQPLQHPTPAPTEPKPRPAIFRAIRQPAAMVVGLITEMRRGAAC